MRRPIHVAMRGLSMAAALCAGFLVAPSVGAARAQQSSSQTMPGTRNPTDLPPIDGSRPEDPNDPMAAQVHARRVRALADDRQRHIVDETAKVLQLATELKVDVSKTNKNEIPPEVVKKAEDIEKLAHDVKQRMRG